MKKLSRILTRRRAGRTSEVAAEVDSPSARDSSPDYHQLTPRRVNGSAPTRQRSFPRTGSSRVIANDFDEEEPPLPPLPKEDAETSVTPASNGPSLELPRRNNGLSARPSTSTSSLAKTRRRPCATCRRIDFPKLLNWQPGDPRPWVSLSHVLANDSSASCPYCSFFQAMVGVSPPDGSGKFAPYLRIRLAFERFGGISEKHELGRQVLIEITTRQKTLPWGYIVRATPEEEEEDNESGLPRGTSGSVNGKDAGDAPNLLRRASVASYLSPTSLIRGRVVPPLLDSSLPKTWMEFCKDKHADGACGTATSLVPGLKLVDCDARRVVAAEALTHDELEYVTLSYVRGTDLASSSSRLGEDGALPEKLPALLADAITLTKSLGYQYLWVDWFCTPSDADPAYLEQQLEVMDEIYHNSVLTVVVAAGDGVGDGIPGVSVPREEQLSLKTHTGLFMTTLLRPDLDVGSSKWATRAWTFQEGLLSRRRLVLTPSQAYFQCQSLHCHESVAIPLRLAADVNMGRVFPNIGDAVAKSAHFPNQIKTYLWRQTSDPADRLDAFRGVLRRFAQLDRPVDHFLGLPLFHLDDFKTSKVVSQTDRLAIAMSWVVDRAVPSQDFVDPYCLVGNGSRSEARASRRSFPSWTWLAWTLREEQALTGHTIQFGPGTDALPVAPGVSAAPGLEISVGLGDKSGGEEGVVQSWEADNDAIVPEAAHVQFLRVETLCFDVQVRKEEKVVSVVGSSLGKRGRQLIEAWFLSFSSSNTIAPQATANGTEARNSTDQSHEDDMKPDLTNGHPAEIADLPAGDYELIAVILSGRNWAEPGSGGGLSVATALICTRERPLPQRIPDLNGTSEPQPKLSGEAALDGESIADNGKTPEAQPEGQPDNTNEGSGDGEPEPKAAPFAVPPTQSVDEGNLVRLGALNITYDGFMRTDDNSAVMKGIDPEEPIEMQKWDLGLRLRELDIY